MPRFIGRCISHSECPLDGCGGMSAKCQKQTSRRSWVIYFVNVQGPDDCRFAILVLVGRILNGEVHELDYRHGMDRSAKSDPFVNTFG